MLPIWLATTFPIWLVVFIVLYALATLYLAIKYREVRKFLAGGVLCQLRYTLVSVGNRHIDSHRGAIRRRHFY